MQKINHFILVNVFLVFVRSKLLLPDTWNNLMSQYGGHLNHSSKQGSDCLLAKFAFESDHVNILFVQKQSWIPQVDI